MVHITISLFSDGSMKFKSFTSGWNSFAKFFLLEEKVRFTEKSGLYESHSLYLLK